MKFFQRRSDAQERAAYRTRLERTPVQVSVLTEDGAQAVELIDLASGGCALRVPEALARGLATGAHVRLAFITAERTIETEAAVRNIEAGGVRARVGLQFSTPEHLIAQLDGLLEGGAWRYFNRRQSFRVRTERGAQSAAEFVVLRWGAEEQRFALHDVSTTGISLRIARREEVQLPSGELIDAELFLPVAGSPFRLGVVVAHDSEVGGARRIGLRFDDVATPGLARAQEQILQFVLARQRRVLREWGADSVA